MLDVFDTVVEYDSKKLEINNVEILNANGRPQYDWVVS